MKPHIAIKKKFSQHFLRWQHIADEMVSAVKLDPTSSVVEIGCGDGFLTKIILQKNIARLWVYEIDPEWVTFIQKTIQDKRLTVYHQDILQIDPQHWQPYKPWILLSNLPYQITFPILFLVQAQRALFKEGVVMVQEEVAQKILKTSGRGYGFTSLFFQYYFDWKMLSKVPPQAFEPSPKVFSRLLYFKVKEKVNTIPNEPEFWKFIKVCFHQPRRTLKNNLAQSHYPVDRIPVEILNLRAQQMHIHDFLNIWNLWTK